MDLTFILLTWNSESYIKACLDSLLNELHASTYGYQILIVDNGSHDSTRSIIKHYKNNVDTNIHAIFFDENQGTTYSRNAALKVANGKYIFIVDSDVEVLPGTISRLIFELERNKKIGIIAPRLHYNDGRIQKSTDKFPTAVTKMLRYFFLRQIEKNSESEFMIGELYTVDYAISAFWAMRSEIFDRVGLLDEKIFYSPEDVDFCLRVWKSGYKVIYDSRVWCIHHTQELSRGFKINKLTWEHIVGLLYYFKKHRYFFKRPQFNV